MANSTYTISQHDSVVAIIRAQSYEHAAQIAGRKLYGRSVTVSRTTGNARKSGYFQGYRYDRKVSALNSVGVPFLVGQER